MVYSLESTRSGMRNLRIAQDVHTTSLSSLPPELTLEVTRYLNSDEVLNFRCGSKSVSEACTSEIAQRFSRLYIHSSRRSIARALEICHSDILPIWRDAIEEVVLLGQVDFKKLDKLHRGRVVDIGETRFQPWPRTWTPKLPSTGDTGNTPSQDLYTLLLSSLARLPKLKKVSFDHSPTVPGFNMTSNDVLKETRQRTAESQLPCNKPRRSDLDVLLTIAMANQLQITELDIGLELPMILEPASLPCWINPLSTCPDAVTNLTSLALRFDAGWSKTPLHTLYSQMIRSTKVLQSLSITIRSNRCMWGLWHERAIATLLPIETRLQHLRTLSLSYDLPIYTNSKHPARPSIQMFDFAAFLRHHSGSLKEIHIENILFTNESTGDIKHTLTRMRDCLLLLADICPGRLRWRVPRFGVDPRCRYGDRCTGMAYCKFACSFVVGPGSSAFFESLCMDRFAARLGVEVDGEENLQGWDFGRFSVEHYRRRIDGRI